MAELFIELFSEEIPSILQVDARRKIKLKIEERLQKKEIKFKDDTSLEIFVLPPWEIEKISSLIDCFWNSNSFVEMSPRIVTNYAEKFSKIRTKGTAYNFTSYDRFDLKTTFQPDQIPKLFPDVEFKKLKHPSLTNVERENYFYFGKSVHI